VPGRFGKSVHSKSNSPGSKERISICLVGPDHIAHHRDTASVCCRAHVCLVAPSRSPRNRVHDQVRPRLQWSCCGRLTDTFSLARDTSFPLTPLSICKSAPTCLETIGLGGIIGRQGMLARSTESRHEDAAATRSLENCT